MEVSEYHNIFKHERSHFYYVGTHNAVVKLLNTYLNKKGGNKILDAGCGTGALVKKLSKYGRVWGIDASKEAIKLSHKNKIKVKLASVENIPFKDNTFDALVSVDVLYHKAVKSDVRALKEFKRVLKPGGVLIIKNPAHNWLRGAHDIIIHTKRRYSKNQFGKKLNRAGFETVKLSYINLAFFPLAILKRLSETVIKSHGASDVGALPKFINNLLINIFDLESSILLKTQIPFGLSIFAVAKKPPNIT